MKRERRGRLEGKPSWCVSYAGSVGGIGLLLMWLAVLCVRPCFAAESLDPEGWPCWQGPYGAGFRDFGYELVDDRTKVRELWVSEEQDIPCGWIGAQGERNLGIAGGYGGPMGYRGRIYHAWVRPSGDKVDEAQAAAALDQRPEKWKASGDDIIVCMDAETGKTLWKTSFEGRGWPSQLGMHHALMMPVAWEDKIYLNGSGGWVYCVDAATGKKLWERRLGAVTDEIDKYKEAGITHFGAKNQKDQSRTEHLKPIRRAPFLSVAAVADGVVVVSDERDFKGPADESAQGLTAFDAETGEKLWETPDLCVGGISSPIAATWRDRLSCVAHSKDIAVGLDPKTGEVLWKITPADRGETYVGAGKSTPAAWNGYVILQGCDYEELETPEGGKPKKVMKHVYPSCWKVDGEKPELLWTLERNGRSPGNGRGGNPVIYKGRALVPWSGTLYCLDLETGEELSSLDGPSGILSGTVSDGIYAVQSKLLRVDTETVVPMDQKGGVSIAGDGFDHSCIYKGRLYARKPIQTPPTPGLKDKVDPSKWDPKYAVACYELRAAPEPESDTSALAEEEGGKKEPK